MMRSVLVETCCFPMAYESLLDGKLDGAPHEWLERRGATVAGGVHEINLCRASGEQARLLGMESGAALLQVAQVVCDQDGAPVYTVQQAIRGDRFTLRI